MQLKEKDRNKMTEHKKRLEKHREAIESDVEKHREAIESDVEKHREAIESDVEKVTTQDKIAENPTTKKRATKKKVIDKKAMKERQKAIAEKVMDDALKGNIDIGKNYHEEEREGPTVVITKEERAKRFERLHAMVQDMMKKRNE